MWGLRVVCGGWGGGLLSRLRALSPTPAAPAAAPEVEAVLTGAEHLDPVRLEVEKRVSGLAVGHS